MANFTYAKGGELESCPFGPPMLDREQNRVEGLAFIGLSLTRYYDSDMEQRANETSVTRQKQFDFNLLQDRDYQYFCSTNDDGWLVGGGENESSYKLPNPDSAHCEIMRIGTFQESMGGVSVQAISEAIESGHILIPHMAVMPSYILKNGDSPPEIELKFEMEMNGDVASCESWYNWQLQFVHNQLFQYFKFPGRFCPGPFHMTFVRKATFRSEQHMIEYFRQCSHVLSSWRRSGPQYLEPETDPSAPGCPDSPLQDELERPHGVYLFRHRNLPVKYFAPNFHPPYNTPEKREIIAATLRQSWDEKTLSWKKLW